MTTIPMPKEGLMNITKTTWKRIGHDAAGVAILALGATATACHDLGSVPDWLRATAGAALVVSAGTHLASGQVAAILSTVSTGTAPTLPQLADAAASIDPDATTTVEKAAAPVVAEAVDLTGMSKEQLLAEAEKVGAQVFKSWTKPEIADAITAATNTKAQA